MRNFIIFFRGKEGTSPLVRLLDNFESVSVVRQVDTASWEPFDRHSCGPMRKRDLERCLDMVFGGEPLDLERLNALYTKTATAPLERFDTSRSVGFKMRFQPSATPVRALLAAARRVNVASDVIERQLLVSHKRMMFDVIQRHGLVVFLAVRQDVFRWALSRYHGSGSSTRGHLQFKLADGRMDRSEIPKIHVECDELEQLITDCERYHARNRVLADELRASGIEVHALRYEDFLRDQMQYFQTIADVLELGATRDEVEASINAGSYFSRVHGDDISEFVENHEEVESRFSHRF